MFHKRYRPGVTLIEIVVVLAILLLLLAFALPFLFRVREQAESARGRNNLHQLGIAAHNYHDVFRAFPPIVGQDPNGVSASLLFHLLPYLEQGPLHRKGPASALSTPVALFLDAGDKSAPPDNKFENWLATTNYAGNWLVFQTGGRRLANIADGTSNTLMIAERYQVCNGTPCGWGYDRLYYWAPMFGYYSMAKFQHQPRDRQCDPALAQSLRPEGILATMCDGSVRTISDRVSPVTWHSVLTPDGGEILFLDD